MQPNCRTRRPVAGRRVLKDFFSTLLGMLGELEARVLVDETRLVSEQAIAEALETHEIGLPRNAFAEEDGDCCPAKDEDAHEGEDAEDERAGDAEEDAGAAAPGERRGAVDRKPRTSSGACVGNVSTAKPSQLVTAAAQFSPAGSEDRRSRIGLRRPEHGTAARMGRPK